MLSKLHFSALIISPHIEKGIEHNVLYPYNIPFSVAPSIAQPKEGELISTQIVGAESRRRSYLRRAWEQADACRPTSEVASENVG